MRAAFKKGRDVQIRDITLRPLGPGEVRVKVDACGVCGTDLHVNPAGDERESGFGHEVAGTILEVGVGVTQLRPGQRVVLDSATPCGRCENCRNARQELCTDIQSFWFTNTFGFAEEMIAPAICAFPCEDLAPEVACLQEPLGVAIDLVRLADITPTSNVLLLGAGPIGLMALALVRRHGARRVFVSEFARAQARCEVAQKFGADRVIDPSVTPLDKVDFGGPIDRILVTTPPPTLKDAFTVACKGGIVAFIGIAYGENAFCRFDANAFHFKKLQLRASFASPALFGPLAVQKLREGVVDGNALVSHRFPLAELSRALDTARTDPRAIKVVITP